MNGIHQLKAFCNYKTGRSILRHALGIEKMPNAPAIADKMIVICLDTESWVHDHRLTEIGLTALDATEAHPITTPGPHGENYLKLIYFYHYRLKPTAHLVNRKNAHSGDPEKNRFGVTKFVTFQEASNLLRNAFNWEVDPGNPHKGYCPIVFVGHAVRNDIDTLTQALGMSPTDFNTVVKTIDTQQLAREVGINTGNFQISLSKLTNLHDIEYRSGHTACNDAAYTIFNAVLMALRNELYISPTGTQQITNNTKASFQGANNL